MTERNIRISTLLSVILWTLGAGVVVLGVLSKAYGIPAIGLLLAGLGAVFNIKGFVLRCEDRMQSAFDMGREYERANPTPKVRS